MTGGHFVIGTPSKRPGGAGGVWLGERHYGKRDCGKAYVDVSGDGKIATGKTETAEHAPLSHSKASHAEAHYTLRHGGRGECTFASEQNLSATFA